MQRKCSRDADIGIMVAANEEWGVMARYDECFEFDDFLVFRRGDVVNYESSMESAYLRHVSSKLDLSAPRISFVLSDDIPDMVSFNGWLDKKELIGLYKYRDMETRIYIGNIISLTTKTLMLSEIDCEAESDGVFRHYSKSISAISFGGGYTQMLQKMLGMGDGDEYR